MRILWLLAVFTSVFTLTPNMAGANGETLSPNMSLVVPAVGQTVGPQWASDINASLGIIDSHDHSPGKGVQVTPAGLNISSDLSCKQNNLTNVRSLRLYPWASSGSFDATASDVGAVYEVTPELYYIDGAGNNVQITKNGFVNSGAGSISGLSGYPNASASYSGTSGTFVWQQAVNTAANMDSAALILRYPGSYPSPSGNYTAIQANASLSVGYSFTLPAAPPSSSQSALVSDTSGNLSYLTPDAIGTAMSSVGANSVANSRTRATGSTVGIGGVAISASSGGFSTTSSSPVAVTNLSVTITTTGRPVFIGLVSDSTGSNAFIQANGNSIAEGLISIRRGVGLVVSTQLVGDDSTSSTKTIEVPVSSINHIDTPSAGTYNYLVYANVNSGVSVEVVAAALVAYEL